MRKKFLFQSLFGAAIIAGILLASEAHAAAEIVTRPQSPGSFSPVEFEVQDFATDITHATITWTLNGKTVSQGIGDTKFSTRTGASGTPLVVTAKVSGIEGLEESRSITLRPADVDLIWQANTTVPTFYRGKALLSPEASAKVVAIPHVVVGGKEVAPEKLLYTWTVDDKLVQAASGFGKSSMIATHNVLEENMTVSVHIETLDGTNAGDNSVVIPVVTPEIHFYEEGPLKGTLLNSALDNGAVLSAGEGTIRAVPYFFSTASVRGSTIQLDWSVDGESTPLSAQAPYLITIRTEKGRTGESTLSFRMQDTAHLLQNAHSSFSVQFGSLR